MMNKELLMGALDTLYPDARCELNYNKDYELLIAVVLSAQSTDKRVNTVTEELFKQYDIFTLAKAKVSDIEKIIRPAGTYHRKAIYVVEIAKSLVDNYNGVVPNNREYLESLPGVGHKTANVVLSNIYDVAAIAVDTHVSRVAKRLKLAKDSDDVVAIEKKLMKYFPKDKWGRVHHQLVLFGRYVCKSQRPECGDCLLKDNCPYFKKIKKDNR